MHFRHCCCHVIRPRWIQAAALKPVSPSDQRLPGWCLLPLISGPGPRDQPDSLAVAETAEMSVGQRILGHMQEAVSVAVAVASTVVVMAAAAAVSVADVGGIAAAAAAATVVNCESGVAVAAVVGCESAVAAVTVEVVECIVTGEGGGG